MEAFAIWNLIKSALSAVESTSANGKSGENTPSQTSSESTILQEKDSVPSTPSNASSSTLLGANSTPNLSRPNACEEYFLRHEQLKNHRKK